MPSRVRVKRWEQERARAGRLESERIVLTSVRARGASRPRGEEHETTFAAAVEALPRRCLAPRPFSTAAFRIQTNPRCGRAGWTLSSDRAAFARGTSNGAAVSTLTCSLARAMAWTDVGHSFSEFSTHVALTF